MKRILTYVIDDKYDGMQVKNVLSRRYQMSSHLITHLKKYADGIMVNGRHVRTTYRLSKGEELQLTIYDTASENILSTPMPLSIVYEDEDIVLVNKPPYLPTHPSAGNYENTLANGFMSYWRSKHEARVFRAVNRLDKNTSGIMAVAKNMYVHARLCDQIKNGQLNRTYLAVVCGNTDRQGRIDAPIARAEDSIVKRCVRSGGQHAVTHYTTLKYLKGYSLVQLCLETGRTHQIRVHMAHIGHPLAGDFLYGRETPEIPRQLLHSYSIEFCHPVTGEKIAASCELPEDMKKIIKKHA